MASYNDMTSSPIPNTNVGPLDPVIEETQPPSPIGLRQSLRLRGKEPTFTTLTHDEYNLILAKMQANLPIDQTERDAKRSFELIHKGGHEFIPSEFDHIPLSDSNKRLLSQFLLVRDQAIQLAQPQQHNNEQVDDDQDDFATFSEHGDSYHTVSPRVNPLFQPMPHEATIPPSSFTPIIHTTTQIPSSQHEASTSIPSTIPFTTIVSHSRATTFGSPVSLPTTMAPQTQGHSQLPSHTNSGSVFRPQVIKIPHTMPVSTSSFHIPHIPTPGPSVTQGPYIPSSVPMNYMQPVQVTVPQQTHMTLAQPSIRPWAPQQQPTVQQTVQQSYLPQQQSTQTSGLPSLDEWNETKKLLQTLRDEMRLLKAANTEQVKVFDFYHDDPINPTVPPLTLPTGVPMPTLTKYNGEGDPNAHLVTFKAECLQLQTWPHSILRVFSMSLVGKALDWYRALPRGSISSLEELFNQFVNHFKYNLKPEATLDNLIQIRQAPLEPVQKFIQRWIATLNELHEPIPETYLLTMFKGAVNDFIKSKLYYLNAKTLSQAFGQTKNIEEAAEMSKDPAYLAYRNQHARKDKEKTKPTIAAVAETPKSNKGKQLVESTTTTTNRTNTFERKDPAHFTPLPYKPSQILDQLLKSRLIKHKPMSAAAAQRYNRFCELVRNPMLATPNEPPVPKGFRIDRFCEYHQCNGHGTDYCFVLRQDIQKLLDKGELSFDQANPVQPQNQTMGVYRDPLNTNETGWSINTIDVGSPTSPKLDTSRNQYVYWRPTPTTPYTCRIPTTVAAIQKFPKASLSINPNDTRPSYIYKKPFPGAIINVRVPNTIASTIPPPKEPFKIRIPSTTLNSQLNINIKQDQQNKALGPPKPTPLSASPVAKPTDKVNNKRPNRSVEASNTSNNPSTSAPPKESNVQWRIKNEQINKNNAAKNDNDIQAFADAMTQVAIALKQKNTTLSLYDLVMTSKVHREALIHMLTSIPVDEDLPADAQAIHAVLSLPTPPVSNSTKLCFDESAIKVDSTNGNVISDPMLITARVGKVTIRRVHVDDGAATNVVPYHVINQLGLTEQIKQTKTPGLRSFNGSRVDVKGTITLDLVASETFPTSADFVVVDEMPGFNMILGRPWLAKLRAISSPIHKEIHFLYEGREIILHGDTGNPSPVANVSIEQEIETDKTIAKDNTTTDDKQSGAPTEQTNTSKEHQPSTKFLWSELPFSIEDGGSDSYGLTKTRPYVTPSMREMKRFTRNMH